MFTAKPQKNRKGATEYFDEHLSQNDYYTQQESLAGHWIGEGAERLGLKCDSEVTRESFMMLCDNLNPETGEKLTQLNLSERRIFFDFTCSAPKSVSILGVTMDDKRIIEAHTQAAAFALKELEVFAATRVRISGAMEDRTTGNLIGAAFQHTVSRALDPQLHTHFTLFNATFDSTENRWKALQTSDMYQAIHYGTAVYRNELTRRLNSLGYKTRANAHGFEIEGVSSKLIQQFSKRAKQRNALVAKREKELGRKLSHNEVSHIVHKSRPEKQRDLSEHDIRAGQLSEIGFFEKRTLRALIAEANGELKDSENRVSHEQAIEHSVEHVFARKSVAAQHELLEAALVKGCGHVELPELKRLLDNQAAVVHVGKEYSTREILRSELSLIRMVNGGINATVPLAPRFKVDAVLGQDQRAALGLVLSSRDTISGFRGLAGTGKTTTLKELRRAVETVGLVPVFCAPTASATEVLRKDGFNDASTLAKVLQSNTVPRQSVIVLDEAGFVGTSDMERLFELSGRNDARVVLVGDSRQHASVARGDALRVIEEHSGYRFGELTQIRRQQTEEFRQVVSLAANHETEKAFIRLEKSGAVIEHDDTDILHQRAAEAYLEVIHSGKTALLVAPTWDEIDGLTEAVRSKRRENKELGLDEEKVRVFDSLGWTEAQKRLVEHYEPGQQLRFVKTTAHFKAGDLVEVEGSQGKQLLVRLEDGRTRSLSPERTHAAFEVGESRELQIATGDVLLLRANAPGFVNGERVAIKSLNRQSIELTDGRMLPANYRSFTHGYAVTSHASQGKTVDEVLVVASTRSFAAVSREQFYVSISRGRERVRIYTDDSAQLRSRVHETHTRKAAVELEGLHETLRHHGYEQSRRKAAEQKIEPEPPKVSVRQSVSRVVRHVRALRLERLNPIERVTQWTASFREWWSESKSRNMDQTEANHQTVRQGHTERAELPRQVQKQSYRIRI